MFHLARHNADINTNMFWYSENSSPKLFMNDKSIFDYAYFSDIQVGQHFVWTKEFAEFLKQFTNSRIVISGSILFYKKQVKFDKLGLMDLLGVLQRIL